MIKNDSNKNDKHSEKPGRNIKRITLRTISDVVIHYILGRRESEKSLVSFINAVFSDSKLPQIQSAKVANPFNPQNYAVEKSTILDIKATDENSRYYNIEIQVLEHESFIERCLFYSTNLYGKQLKKKESYRELKPVISIILTDFQLFKDIDLLHLSFYLMAKEVPDCRLTDHLEFHFIQMPQYFDAKIFQNTNAQLVDWLKFFGYPTKTDRTEFQKLGRKDEGLIMARKAYENFKKDPDLYDIALRREIHERDSITLIADSFASGKKEGLKEGEEKGVKRGEKRGEKRGVIKGKKEGVIETLIQLITWMIGKPDHELAGKLKKMTDIEKLKTIFEAVGTRKVTTFAELEKML